MESELARLKKRKKAQEALHEIGNNKKNAWIIHYSCESFYKDESKSKRITSIAVRNLDTAQTISFSIHQLAEIHKYDMAALEQHYDSLEKELLDNFYDFIRKHTGSALLHWNMRDMNYGFPALEHRFKVLGGYSVPIDDSCKYDVARILVGIYGLKYAGHPRLESIVKMNHISDLNFLGGQAEADAFEAKEYYKLHLSTLRKVDVMANIFERSLEGRLVVGSPWWEIHGMHPKIVVEYLATHWIVTLVLGSIGLLASFYQIWDHHHPR